MYTAFRKTRILTTSPQKKNGLFLLFFTRKEGIIILGFDRNGTRSPVTVGIIGCDGGIGVTHLGIALCSYCASKRRGRTAFIELHERTEIAQLCPKQDLSAVMAQSAAISLAADKPGTPLSAAHVRQYPHFRLHGVDYYPRTSGSALPSLLNQGYDYLILDLGSRTEADISEFLRCDKKLVLGSPALWKLWSYESFFQSIGNSINLGEGLCYLVQTGNLKNLTRIAKLHHIEFSNVPFIKNPFRIEKELFLFFETLLTGT